jgi:hypothetical protein
MLSYILFSTRGVKRLYKIDHNTNPRDDVAKYGEQKVKDGKITRRQLDRLIRLEAAHQNAMGHFPFIMGTVVSFLGPGISVVEEVTDLSSCSWLWQDCQDHTLMEWDPSTPPVESHMR